MQIKGDDTVQVDRNFCGSNWRTNKDSSDSNDIISSSGGGGSSNRLAVEVESGDGGGGGGGVARVSIRHRRFTRHNFNH